MNIENTIDIVNTGCWQMHVQFVVNLAIVLVIARDWIALDLHV